jgi:hypothetical protein
MWVSLSERHSIDHILAAPEHPQTCGKIEAVNKPIQKELIDRVEFRNYLDSKEQIGRWIDEFNRSTDRERFFCPTFFSTCSLPWSWPPSKSTPIASTETLSLASGLTGSLEGASTSRWMTSCW